jgi:diguanylate cyclase (GGDEF)-like protein/PAS domain S-box-containing protein
MVELEASMNRTSAFVALMACLVPGVVAASLAGSATVLWGIAGAGLGVGGVGLVLTARQRLSKRLDQHTLHHAAMNAMSEGVLFICVRSGVALDGNRTARNVLGLDDSEFPPTPLSEVVEGEPAIMAALLESITDGRRVDRLELALWGRGRGPIPIEVSVAPIEHRGRSLATLVFRDITERRQAQDRARHFAYHDPLTGLPNRLLFRDRLASSLAQAERAGEHLGVIFIDVDHFKEVNDTLGHEVGDALLQGVAERLSSVVRVGDAVARQGGDEFMVLLPRLVVDAESVAIAERLVLAMREPFRLGIHEVRVSASIGVSVYPRDGRDAESLVRHADLAMYQSKQRGRDAFTLFDEALNERATSVLEMRPRLERAMERDELAIHYQPQIDARSAKVVGFEALLRWKSTELGWIPPATFIPVAEETGLMGQLGHWVLFTVCTQVKSWCDAGIDVPRVSVNASTKQLADRAFVEMVRRTLETTGVDPKRIELEVTEGLAVKDPEGTRRILDELKSLGLRVALDDFGTGTSSLSNLRRFPFDRLKMHRDLHHGLVDSRADQAMVQSVVSLADSLGIEVVASGVETTDQLRLLCEMGCDVLQGFGLARPMPSDDVARFLKSGGSVNAFETGQHLQEALSIH